MWCDICEKNVKGRTHKFGDSYASVYICEKHKGMLKRAVKPHNKRYKSLKVNKI